MAGNQPARIAGPAFISNAAANIYTPQAATIQTVIQRIYVVNVTAGAVTFTLYIGATGGSAAGTEIVKDYSLAAKGGASAIYNDYSGRNMKSTDFLTGIASAASSLVIIVDGYFWVSV